MDDRDDDKLRLNLFDVHCYLDDHDYRDYRDLDSFESYHLSSRLRNYGVYYYYYLCYLLACNHDCGDGRGEVDYVMKTKLADGENGGNVLCNYVMLRMLLLVHRVIELGSRPRTDEVPNLDIVAFYRTSWGTNLMVELMDIS